MQVIVTSDLIRAQQTAEAIARTTEAPIVLATDALRPWHVGDITGKDIFETLPILRDHATNRQDTPLPGGESFNTFRERFLRGVQILQETYADKHVAIVTHHHGDRIMAAWEAVGFPDDLNLDFDIFLQKGIDPASFRTFTMSRPAA